MLRMCMTCSMFYVFNVLITYSNYYGILVW